MSFDTPTMAIAPVTFLATAAYTAFSLFVSGQVIGSREIERSDWTAQCHTTITTVLESQRKPAKVIPNVPNVGDLLCSVYPELQQVCDMIPDPSAHAREIERLARAAEDARIANAARGAADRCACAEAVYLEDERISLALYAATARLHRPNAIKNRTALLTRALNGPACSVGQEG
jgi:hypothetical protein